MSNPWFRMYAEFATDPKVQMMAEVMQRRFVMLLCLRCSNTLVTLQDDEVAFQLRIDADELEKTKALFIGKKFIDEHWNLLNWEKRQFKSDTSNARVVKHRALQKEKQKDSGNVDVTLQKRKCNALDTDTDTDIERDKSLSSTSASPKLPDCPHLEILSLFAEHLPTLAQPRPESWDGKRAGDLRARWRWVLTKTRKTGERYAENKEQGLAWFARFFAYVADSDFLMGRAGNFTVTLDWLVNQTNFSKVLDGNYANRTEVAA